MQWRDRVEAPFSIAQQAGPDLTLEIGEVGALDRLNDSVNLNYRRAEKPGEIYLAAAAITGTQHQLESLAIEEIASNLQSAANLVSSPEPQPVVSYSSYGVKTGASIPESSLIFSRESLYDTATIEVPCSTTSVYSMYGGEQITEVERTATPSSLFLGVYGYVISETPSRDQADIDTREFFNHKFLGFGRIGVNRLLKALAEYELGDREENSSWASRHSSTLLILGELRDQGITLGASRTSLIRDLGKQTASTLIAGTANLSDYSTGGVFIRGREKPKSAGLGVAERLRGVTFYSTDHAEISKTATEICKNTPQGAFLEAMASKNGRSLEEYMGAQTKDFMQLILGLSM
jgi:hypothetical protein